eukprot:g4994.t1
MPAPRRQPAEQQHVMDRGSFVSAEGFESLTCGAAPGLIGRLRTAADSGQEALKELAEEVQSAATSRLGSNRGGGGGVEVAFGRAMGRSFYATADGSTTAADIVLFFTLDPLDIDTKQSTCVRRGCDLESATVMQALYKIEPGASGGSGGSEGAVMDAS